LAGAPINGGAGTLTNSSDATLVGPGSIVSPFVQQGLILLPQGTLTVIPIFTNAGQIELHDVSANLRGGAITNNQTIEGVGRLSSNTVNNGTIEAIGGTLTIAGTLSNSASGLLAAN